ncbi:glutamate--cysteine ligase [Corynebacterium incognita]|uniref:Putative glutamate--cysteine ligase 2 n=1 Tax=Corynebacterium incognita TaxID=2754725 RepID=A0A7G7CRH8_9CORY|nr:glutamate--cysteine ligase [Corynebacterium incognita]QNE90194.1 glutamate--cysteine ligase [Corynebacterium incognita]
MKSVDLDFDRSPEPTLGVEWEVALVDPENWNLVSRAEEVIDEVRTRHPEIHVDKEFLRNTVEMVTDVCTTVPEAISQLEVAHHAIKEVAEEKGMRLWSAGAHPFADFREDLVADKESYREIIERTQIWGKHMLIWGTHVHVGISHEDRVWPIINALMTKFPHLLALSASSPGWDGMDTGYASQRTMLYQQLPTAGMPYQFETWEQWQGFLKDQATSGVINHTGSMHLDIRPAATLGTIEVRVCDSSSNLREISALVALVHCLVVYFDRMVDAGEELPILQQWHVAENKWRAARYGLDALIITTRDTEERWVTDEIRDLVATLADVAGDIGCARELALVEEILDRGASYQRQREWFADNGGDWCDVVARTAAEMDELRPLDAE